MTDGVVTPPILPQDYLYGVKVVDIGDLRVARGMTRRPHSTCRHVQLIYDEKERRVWCEDCETDVEPFDAFVGLIQRFDAFEKKAAELRSLENLTIVSRAAKALDKIYRGHAMAPCCPHCNRGILPEDVVRGMAQVGREFELRRRSGGKL